MKAIIALVFLNVLSSALGEQKTALDKLADEVLASQAKLSKALHYNIHTIGKFTRSARIGTLTCTNGRVGDYSTLVRYGRTNLIRNKPRDWINATIPVKIMSPIISFDRCTVGKEKKTSPVTFHVKHHLFKLNLGFNTISKACKLLTSLVDLSGIKLKAPNFSSIGTAVIQQLLNWFKGGIIKDITKLAGAQLKHIPYSLCKKLQNL